MFKSMASPKNNSKYISTQLNKYNKKTKNEIIYKNHGFILKNIYNFTPPDHAI